MNLRCAHSVQHSSGKPIGRRWRWPTWLLAGLFCLLIVSPGRGDDPFSRSQPVRQRWFQSWTQYGHSHEGRPIEVLQVGRGPFRTLVLGSVHGSETTAIESVSRLATHLGAMPDHWHEVNVLIVKTPNPDGLARGSNWNGRGVDLNHNFPRPATDRTPRDSRAGAADCSEIETRLVRHLLESYRPHRVVHVKSTANEFGWALCSRQAKPVSDYLGAMRNIRVGKTEQNRVIGSIEDYASNALNLEVVTLAVPSGPDPKSTWDDYRNPLLAAAAYVDPDWKSNRQPVLHDVAKSRATHRFGTQPSIRRPTRRTRRNTASRKSPWDKLSLPIQFWPRDKTSRK